MGMRSIVEFNHDHSHSIERDPQGFLTALGQFLASANDRTEETLKRYGITAVVTHHHSEQAVVMVAGRKWPVRS